MAERTRQKRLRERAIDREQTRWKRRGENLPTSGGRLCTAETPSPRICRAAEYSRTRVVANFRRILMKTSLPRRLYRVPKTVTVDFRHYNVTYCEQQCFL